MISVVDLLIIRSVECAVLKGIEYNSSTRGKSECTNEIVTTGSTEDCESENDKKVSFDNMTNVG